jgi:hypothetical protein
VDTPVVIAIIAAIVAVAGFLWQVWIFIKNPPKRIKIKMSPYVSPDVTSWNVVCRVINKGRSSVHISRVQIAHPQNPTWCADLLPGNNEERSVAIESSSEATYTLDGEEAAEILGGFSEFVCKITTSDDQVFTERLQSKDQDFELMCLIASLTVDDGSGRQARFPWPEDRMREGLTTRLVRWKLNCTVSRGWVERRVMPDGEVRYFATDEGRRVKDTGTYVPRFGPGELNSILEKGITPRRWTNSRPWRRAG